MSTILIIDGNNLAHRVRHVFSLTGPDKQDVSVTYGFLHNLKSFLFKFEPDACIVAWDGGIPEFRRERVPSYKANRKKDEDDTYHDFLRQVDDLANKYLPAAGVLNVKRRRMEADDIMYHAAFMSLYDYDTIIIISGDEDMYQAVTMRNVVVYSPSKKVIVNREYVEKEYGIPYNTYVHWKAIQGDSSDNVQGVPGIGPKKATKLFQDFGTISAIMNAAYGNNPEGSITGKMRDNLQEFGIQNISNNVYIMALYADRTGARIALYEELDYYQEPNLKKFKDLLFSQAFTSIMEPDFYRGVTSLKKPTLNLNIRMPIICERRFPIE